MAVELNRDGSSIILKPLIHFWENKKYKRKNSAWEGKELWVGLWA
jgi:hypothetical protein